MNKIDIHADDYGYTLNTSKDILDSIKKEELDSISIICNTSFFDESMELFYKTIPQLKKMPCLSIHLNLVEGYCLSDSSLLSNDGVINVSWGNLLKYSFLNRNEAKKQIKDEIIKQIDITNEKIEKCINIAKENNIKVRQKGLRIDSHMHTHAIPVVFEALKEVIEEGKYNVEYIRNPKESITPFIKKIKLWPTYSIVNIAKNLILNVFSTKIDKYCENKKIEKTYLCGLVLSGKMDYLRIKEIYSLMIDKSKRDGRTLEMLFHPGRALNEEISKELNKDNMNNFNLSYNRSIEKDTLSRLKEVNYDNY